MGAEHPLPSVSVVTIALNAARDLPLTLESAIGQSYPRLERVVVDGMSWDDTAAILARYDAHIDRLVVQEDAGIYHAMNAAADLASGDYILFLNAGDTFFDADAVARAVAALRDDPDIFYGNHIYVDGGLELFRRSASFEEIAYRLAGGTMDHRWHAAIPGHQATFTRTALLRETRYDTQLRVGADHELLFRAHAAGARLAYVDEIVAHYHGGGFSQRMGMRTTLENVSTYRRFSDAPGAVDALFMTDGSPFPIGTARTGVKLGGLLPPAPRDGGQAGGERVAADGARILSSMQSAWGIEITGHGTLDGQSVAVLDGDMLLAWVPVPTGGFRVEIPFNRLVAPATPLLLKPGRTEVEREGEPAAGFALGGFRMLTLDHQQGRGMRPGDVLEFRASSKGELADVLGGGWSAPEPTHLWSIGPRSDLWLRAARGARGLRLELSGNPHVDGGDQPVRLLLNGSDVAATTLRGGGRDVLEVSAEDAAWLAGRINHLAIVPERVATPPAGTGDTRLLGVCLWRLELV